MSEHYFTNGALAVQTAADLGWHDAEPLHSTGFGGAHGLAMELCEVRCEHGGHGL